MNARIRHAVAVILTVLLCACGAVIAAPTDQPAESTVTTPPFIGVVPPVASNVWTYSSLPLNIGSHTIVVTAAPEFLVFRLPSFLASDGVISYGRLVPLQMIVSAATQPAVVPLSSQSPYSFVRELLAEFSAADSANRESGIALQTPPPEQESLSETVHRVGREWSASPTVQKLKARAIGGLALASLVWCMLLSAQVTQAARSLRSFPVAAVLYGLIGAVVFALLVVTGWKSKIGLIVPLFAIVPLFPLLLVAPAVTAMAIGQCCLGKFVQGRAWPLAAALLVVCVWFLVLVPAIGPLFFASALLGGTGGLILAGSVSESSVRVSEINPPEVVS